VGVSGWWSADCATAVTTRPTSSVPVRRREIEVDTNAVGIVQFDAPAAKRATLLASGEEAAGQFLSGWDWEGCLQAKLPSLGVDSRRDRDR
jgi:hypothetical protein